MLMARLTMLINLVCQDIIFAKRDASNKLTLPEKKSPVPLLIRQFVTLSHADK